MEKKYMILILACFGFCTTCNKSDDTSGIDYSNIENLYEQPLPVIQKCVEGKWKWIVMFGDYVGAVYFENTYVEIDTDYIIINRDGVQQTINYKWIRDTFLTRNLESIDRWVIWDTDQNAGVWFFDSILSDTLSVGHAPLPDGLSSLFRSEFIRVK